MIILSEIDYIQKAMQYLRPGCKYCINSGGFSSLEWQDIGTNPPSLEEFNSALEIVKSDWLETEYRRLRETSYPSIGDQLDALFHAGVFPQEMAEKIQAIKDKYPKPIGEANVQSA